MHTTLSDSRVWERWRGAKQLALLATFEDSTTGTRIKEFRQDLSRRLDEHCRLIEHVWLFSTFRLRELREIAAEEASAADVVIISVHDAEGLPEEVKSWIDLWLQLKGTRPGLLVALLDEAHEGVRGTIEAYLQEIAQRAGLEFLVESRTLPEGRWRGR
jgi:hypothetical protein